MFVPFHVKSNERIGMKFSLIGSLVMRAGSHLLNDSKAKTLNCFHYNT